MHLSAVRTNAVDTVNEHASGVRAHSMWAADVCSQVRQRHLKILVKLTSTVAMQTLYTAPRAELTARNTGQLQGHQPHQQNVRG